MAHFVFLIETGRSMESISLIDFLAFPVSFDLLDEGMNFGLKNKEDIGNLLIQLAYAFFLVQEISEH